MIRHSNESGTSKSLKPDSNRVSLTRAIFGAFGAGVFTGATARSYQSDSFDVADRVIDSHIKNLRRKISEAADTGNRHEWVQAVYGVGYRFEYPED